MITVLLIKFIYMLKIQIKQKYPYLIKKPEKNALEI